MQSWKSQLSPKNIQDVSSYVKSLTGTKPAGAKEPQGTLYKEEATTPDSTVAKQDTVAITPVGAK
jgi:cytochrome c oxidase cbb3-type subunit III